jgi:hypothetical protein
MTSTNAQKIRRGKAMRRLAEFPNKPMPLWIDPNGQHAPTASLSQVVEV